MLSCFVPILIGVVCRFLAVLTACVSKACINCESKIISVVGMIFAVLAICFVIAFYVGIVWTIVLLIKFCMGV